MWICESSLMPEICILLILITTLVNDALAETDQESCSVFAEGMIHTSVNPLILYGKGEGNPRVDFMFKDWTQRKPVSEFEMNVTDSWEKFEIYATYTNVRNNLVLSVVVNNGTSKIIGPVLSEEIYIRIKETEGIQWALCQVPVPQIENMEKETPTLQPVAAAASDNPSETSDITWVLVAAVVVLAIAVVILSVLLYQQLRGSEPDELLHGYIDDETSVPRACGGSSGAGYSQQQIPNSEEESLYSLNTTYNTRMKMLELKSSLHCFDF